MKPFISRNRPNSAAPSRRARAAAPAFIPPPAPKAALAAAVAAALAAAIPLPGYAQSSGHAAPPGHNNGGIDTIVVRAARDPVPLSELGSAVTLLERDWLEQRQGAALGELLRAVPGLAVSRSGVAGSQAQLRLRGAEANHVLVFIDGVKANDAAQDGGFNPSHLLNRDLESVEVVRGPQSALWGSEALAGVIDIRTRRADGSGLSGSVSAEGGSHAWRSAGGRIGYGGERLRADFSANHLQTDGENIARKGNEEDGYENRTFNLGWDYAASEQFRLEGRARYTEARNDYDGTQDGLPVDAPLYADVQRAYASLGAGYAGPGGRWRHRLRYTFTEADNADHGSFGETNADAAVYLLSYQLGFAPADGHHLTAALERAVEDFAQRGMASPFGNPNHNDGMSADSLVLEYRGRLSDAFSVFLSARHDDNSDFNDKTTGRLSAAWRIGEGAKLRAAVGTGVKNPTFVERFGYFTNFRGNPALEPEESLGWEIGADGESADQRLQWSLTWFAEELEDEINGFVFRDGAATAENEDGASERRGLEFSGAWRPTDGLRFGFAYTWLDATEEDAAGEERNEIRRPKHLANANIQVRLSERAEFNLNADYNGRQEDDWFTFPAQRVRLDDFVLVSLAGSYALTRDWRLLARVENALDEDYEEVFGYATPGRAAYFGMRYGF